MLSYVIPRFSGFFEDLGQELPWITQLLIFVSGWAQKTWFVIPLLFVGGGILIQSHLQNKSKRKNLHRILLDLPVAGSLVLKADLARVSRTLELLLKSGISILNSVKIAVPVLSNEMMRAELENCYKTLEEGGTLSEGLRQSPRFPSFICHLVSVGEEAGRLDEVLGEIAEWYEQDTSESIRIFTTLLEPVIILSVGLILGAMIIAVLLPIFSINAMIG